MPAPTPIQIRYGPSGLLGQAVAAAASGQAQQDRDFQFLNSMTEHKNRTDEMLLNDSLQSHQLQLAHGYRVAQEQNPDPNYYNGATNPAAIDAANMALKNTYLTSAAADLPSEQATQLQALMGNRSVTPEQFRNVIFDATKKAKEKTDESTELTSRRNYVKAASQGLSPQDAATLSSMAEDKRVTTAQLRTAVDAIRGRNAAGQQRDRTFEAQNIDKQLYPASAHMQSLRKSLAAAGIDPDTVSPASLTPTYANANAPTYQTMGVMQSIKDTGYVPGTGSLVSGGQPANVMQQYLDYHRTKKQYNDLLAQRQQLLAGGGATPAGEAPAPAAAPSTGGTMSLVNESGWPVANDVGAGVVVGQSQGGNQSRPITPQIAAQFLQQANGNTDLARQMAASQGYTF